MVIRNYVGARYVPKFADPVEWHENTSYEAMVIVTYNNSSYTSKIPVPPTVGNPAENPTYWALTGNYNAQVEEYRKATANAQEDINELKTKTGTNTNDINELKTKTGTNTNDINELKTKTGTNTNDINELKTKTGTNTNDIAETSNNLTAHINANNPHHISKDTIGLGKLQNVEYIPKHIDNCPSGDSLDNNYWRNLGTGIYFAHNILNLPVSVEYAFAIVCVYSNNDLMVILHQQAVGGTFILSGAGNINSGWIEFAMKSNNDTITNATIDSICV